MKIDVHTHILPERWPDLRERYGYGGFIRLEHHRPCCAQMWKDDTFFREVEDNCWSAERRIEQCDAAGVDVQVLSTVPVMFSYWAKPDDALDLSRRLNDHIADVVREHPKRFVGLATVPLQSPDLAIAELERAVTDLGHAGIQIGTHVNGANLDDPSLFRVFEAAEALGAAVFVHPWDMLAKERMTKYWLPWLVGMPAETCLAIASLIFSGVFERLPRLRFGFAHGGGSFPGTVARLQHGHDVRPDLCAVDNSKGPAAYLGHFFLDSLVHDAATLRAIVDLVGAHRVMLGSDYPFPLGEHEPGRLIDTADGFDEATRERLRSGTALEFLGRKRAELSR